MDIKTLDLKTKLMAGTVLAVMSGFVPPVSSTAVAGSVTIPVSVEIVTAITLDTPEALDFGRIALTGVASGTHTLSTIGGVTPAVGTSVVVAGAVGGFQIAGGTDAGNVTVTLGPVISYNAGAITIPSLIFGGLGITGTVTAPLGASTAMSFGGGGNANVILGGMMVFNSTPTVGTYDSGDVKITITDIP